MRKADAIATRTIRSHQKKKKEKTDPESPNVRDEKKHSIDGGAIAIPFAPRSNKKGHEPINALEMDPSDGAHHHLY